MNVFEEVRAGVTLSAAIQFLGMKPTETKGSQLRFPCPACKGADRRTFSINLDSGFQCFSGKAKGNDAIALVAHCRGIRQREAAEMLSEHFLRSSTKPREPKASETEGRSGASPDVARSLEHPVIDMLGINPDMLKDIDGGFDGERIVLVLRTPDGTERGTVGIATKPDQVPLLLFSESVSSQKLQPDELRKMFRVVG